MDEPHPEADCPKKSRDLILVLILGVTIAVLEIFVVESEVVVRGELD